MINPSLIITSVNRRYLSGFSSSLGYLFAVDNRFILYVDGRYFQAATKGVKKGVEVRLLIRLKDAIGQIIGEFNLNELNLETEITVSEANSIKSIYKNAQPNQALTDSLYEMRGIKSHKEKEQIIKAQRIAETAFDNILNYIKAGRTEKEVALELEYNCKRLGADDMSFETIAVSGKNSALPHGVPTDKPIENGDFLTMDFGALYGGYCSDMTRTVAIGYADDTMQEIYNTVLTAQLEGINAVKSGVSAKSVDLATRSVIESAGYGEYFNHSTGHGVGLEIHEKPNLSYRSDEILQIGNIITVEPGIYIPEMYGVRIEDMLYVTENGSQNLTNSQKNLIILK